jgi:hypothetical protein
MSKIPSSEVDGLLPLGLYENLIVEIHVGGYPILQFSMKKHAITTSVPEICFLVPFFEDQVERLAGDS